MDSSYRNYDGRGRQVCEYAINIECNEKAREGSAVFATMTVLPTATKRISSVCVHYSYTDCDRKVRQVCDHAMNIDDNGKARQYFCAFQLHRL